MLDENDVTSLEKPVRSFTFIGRARDTITTFASASAPRFAVLVFALLIAFFTLLLSAPFASNTGEVTPLADAFFTAVSTICVAGLTTVDMTTHWSPVGNGLILLGTQIGALGVLTMASILGVIIAGRLGLRSRLMAAGDTNPLRLHSGPVAEGQAVRLGDIGGLLLTIALSLVVVETVIAALMFPSVLGAGYSVGDSIWYSVYYSAMSFTNTGFVPNAEGIGVFVNDYAFLTLTMIGVGLGSIGFPVIYAISRNMRRPKRWPVHVKLTLTAWSLLWVLGAVFIWAFMFLDPASFGSPFEGRDVFQAFFMSTMTRSGGFSLVDQANLDSGMLLVQDMLMFIGGGSASTAGGIKVTTFAVLILAAVAEARGRSSLTAFRRVIPVDVLRLAVSVLIWGAATVSAGVLLITAMSEAKFEFILFEVISAFGTVGLSTGIPYELSDSANTVLALVMFMGRVGTVTLAAALAAQQTGRLYTYPEERPIVG